MTPKIKRHLPQLAAKLTVLFAVCCVGYLGTYALTSVFTLLGVN